MLQVRLALQQEVPLAQLPHVAHQELRAGLAAGLAGIHSAAATGQVCTTPKSILLSSQRPCKPDCSGKLHACGILGGLSLA